MVYCLKKWTQPTKFKFHAITHEKHMYLPLSTISE